MAKIECILKRRGGTVVDLAGTRYHFKPQPDGLHVAVVTDLDHITQFLAVTSAYRLLSGDKGAPKTTPSAPPAPGPGAVTLEMMDVATLTARLTESYSPRRGFNIGTLSGGALSGGEAPIAHDPDDEPASNSAEPDLIDVDADSDAETPDEDTGETDEFDPTLEEHSTFTEADLVGFDKADLADLYEARFGTPPAPRTARSTLIRRLVEQPPSGV